MTATPRAAATLWAVCFCKSSRDFANVSGERIALALGVVALPGQGFDFLCGLSLGALQFRLGEFFFPGGSECRLQCAS